MKIIVEMPWEKDLSVNHMRYGAGGGYRKKPHVHIWMQKLTWIVWTQSTGGISRYHPEILEKMLPMQVCVDFRFPDKRRRDTHNYFKVVCDSVAAGLGIDDKDIRISTGSVVVDRENPGFTVMITDAG